MQLAFSQYPGSRERHLMRKQDNPLFPEPERRLSGEQLLEAQRLDHEELVDFITHFKSLIQQVVSLPSNAESEQILSIKEQLDQSYEQAARLADEQQETKQAIEKLTQVIMQTIRSSAGNDQLALQELEQESSARQAHYRLLQSPLVADILNPDGPILPHELVPTLLSAAQDEFVAALALFDPEQRAILASEAAKLVHARPELSEQIEPRLAALSA